MSTARIFDQALVDICPACGADATLWVIGGRRHDPSVVECDRCRATVTVDDIDGEECPF